MSFCIANPKIETVPFVVIFGFLVVLVLIREFFLTGQYTASSFQNVKEVKDLSTFAQTFMLNIISAGYFSEKTCKREEMRLMKSNCSFHINVNSKSTC